IAAFTLLLKKHTILRKHFGQRSRTGSVIRYTYSEESMSCITMIELLTDGSFTPLNNLLLEPSALYHLQ
ncbi:MAG: hypothetical protein ACPG4U_14010, partial [Pseudomonadales bacterium]